jgi:hypothetical protein
MFPPRMLDPVPNTDMNDGNETGKDGGLVCTGMLDDREPEDNDLRLLGIGIGGLFVTSLASTNDGSWGPHSLYSLGLSVPEPATRPKDLFNDGLSAFCIFHEAIMLALVLRKQRGRRRPVRRSTSTSTRGQQQMLFIRPCEKIETKRREGRSMMKGAAKSGRFDTAP